MKSLREKIIIGLSIFLLANSSIPFTSVMALEKPSTIKEKSKIGIDLPARVSNVKINPSKKISFNKVITGDSEILNISIAPSLSGTTFQVPLELNRGEKAMLYKTEFGKTSNAGNMYDMQNNSIGIINIEIVNNAENVQMTSTVLDNNILQFDVKSNNISNKIDIQVKMNTTSFSTYFTDSEWIKRSGMISLSLSQKQDLASSTDTSLNKAKKIDAWDKIKSKHNNTANWYNAGGLQDQFDCHFDFAKKKDAWNLEPSRPDVDYFSTVMASCNPK